MTEVQSEQPPLDLAHKAKSLISALNLLSRDLPLSPDLLATVSSIYHGATDNGIAGSDATPDDSGVSDGRDLMLDLEDALLNHRPDCLSGSSLTESRENRYRNHIQHRLTELEELPSSRGDDLQTKCLMELYGLKLEELQRKVRTEVSSEYWLRVHCAYPDKQLFDWGMMRLCRPLYGVGDAFAMEADDQFRKKRDAERLSRLEEQEKSQIDTRKKKFFLELLNAVREFQLQLQASLKRRKQRNDGVQAWHGRQRQRATRAEKLRFQALKADDQEAYMRMAKKKKIPTANLR